MRNPQGLTADPEDVVLSLGEHRRLIKMVSVLAGEVERLREDNIQLYAAVAMYQEAIRKAGGDDGGALPAIPLRQEPPASDSG